MSLLKLADVWKTLRENKEKFKDGVIEQFKEFVQDEEFGYAAIIDDLADEVDESSINHWLQNKNWVDQFSILREIIVPNFEKLKKNKEKKKKSKKNRRETVIQLKKRKRAVSFRPAHPNNNNDFKNNDDDPPNPNNNNNYDFDDEKKIDNDSDDNDNNQLPPWPFLKQATIIVHNEDSKNDEPSVSDINHPISLNGLDKSNVSAKELMNELVHQLDLNSDSMLISDLIGQLQKYSGDVSASSVSMEVSPEPHSPVFSKHSKTLGADPDDAFAYIRMGLTRSKLYTPAEISEFFKYCESEEFFEDDIIDDLDTFEEGDSAICEYMEGLFNWKANKQGQFVSNLRDILGIKERPPSMLRKTSYNTLPLENKYLTNMAYNPNAQMQRSKTMLMTPMLRSITDESASSANNKRANSMKSISSLLPVSEFVIPISLMKMDDCYNQSNMEDVYDVFRENRISNGVIGILRSFCDAHKVDSLHSFNVLSIGSVFKSKFADIGDEIVSYISKIQFELREPSFKAVNISKKDEESYSKYLDNECPGIIKHDRDLLKYFLLTRATEHDLASLLVDIVDRISIDDDYQLDMKSFSKRNFFNDLNNKQTSIIRNGLRTYHNRFFPRITMSPITLICDRISDYQKYMCLLSSVMRVNTVCPALVDFSIVSPGIYSRINGNFSAEKCMNLGHIPYHLKNFGNDSLIEIQGLSDEKENFDEKTTQKQIVKDVADAIARITNANERVCVMVDRRWRIKSRKWVLYNKLRKSHDSASNYDHESDNKEAFDLSAFKEAPGKLLSEPPPDFSDSESDDDPDDGNMMDNGFGAFSGAHNPSFNVDGDHYPWIHEKQFDTIYVFKPHIYNSFSDKYCPETLFFQTKQCILPRKSGSLINMSSMNYSSQKYSDLIKNSASNMDDDELDNKMLHLGADNPDGIVFNMSIHCHKPNPPVWYKHKYRWYLFTHSASIRFLESDLCNFWCKYFLEPENDIGLFKKSDLKKHFKLDLNECDVTFKRWYHAIKKT